MKIWEVIKSSWLVRLGYGWILCGFVFQCIGFSAPYWNDYSYTDMVYDKTSYHLGLWQSCYQRGQDIKCQLYTVKGGIAVARLFESLALILFIAIIVVLMIHWKKGESKYLLLAAIGCAITAGFIILGAMSWILSATYLQYNLSWSFALCILGAVFCGMTSPLLAQERLNALAIKRRKVSTAEAMMSSTEVLDT